MPTRTLAPKLTKLEIKLMCQPYFGKVMRHLQFQFQIDREMLLDPPTKKNFLQTILIHFNLIHDFIPFYKYSINRNPFDFIGQFIMWASW